MCSSNKSKRALGCALRLLKFRPRSEFELQQRLKQKGFEESAIKESLLFLKKQGLVDDLEFSRVWCESRIKKPLGLRRIKQELKVKGISRNLIEQVIKEASARYNQEEMLKDLIQHRWQRLKHIEPVKARRRLFLYLLRRGFSSEMIQEAISQI